METFTYTLTAEVQCDTDGVADGVVINNYGSLPESALEAIAIEALASWTGRYGNYILHTGARDGNRAWFKVSEQ